jgi:hypothetical protein
MNEESDWSYNQSSTIQLSVEGKTLFLARKLRNVTASSCLVEKL